MPLTDNTPQFYQEAVNTAMLALMEAKTTGNKDAIKAAHKQHDRAKAARKAADQWALSLVVWPEDTQLQTFMKDKPNKQLATLTLSKLISFTVIGGLPRTLI